MKRESSHGLKLQPRIRALKKDQIALGPGKAELLRLLHETGSIREAARQMGMSYMRAWTLIRTMNNCFKEPLVSAERGGRKGGGGAALTTAGRKTLDLYEGMVAASEAAMLPHWKKLQSLLKR